jgi:hypothetical protein
MSLHRHKPLAPSKDSLRRAPLPRGTTPLGRNRKRQQSEFARCYGSEERVEWVKALPCVVCGYGPCDNAHVIGGGISRKAGYESIVPLCSGPHGCHAELHRIGVKTFGRRNRIDLCQAAERIANAWNALHPMAHISDCGGPS